MGTANSNSQQNNQTLDDFFGVFDPANTTGHYGQVNWLVQNVCPNDDPRHPTIPSVGITDHGPRILLEQVKLRPCFNNFLVLSTRNRRCQVR